MHLNEASVEERAAQWPQSGVPEAASTDSAIPAAREHVIAAHDEQVPSSGCTEMCVLPWCEGFLQLPLLRAPSACYNARALWFK